MCQIYYLQIGGTLSHRDVGPGRRQSPPQLACDCDIVANCPQKLWLLLSSDQSMLESHSRTLIVERHRVPIFEVDSAIPTASRNSEVSRALT